MRTELSDIETMRAAKDLSEFLVGNSAAAQKAIKLMAEANERLGRLQADLDTTNRDLEEAEDLLEETALRIRNASFIQRLVYLFTGEALMIKNNATPEALPDLHRQRAARHFGIPEATVTPEQRQEGKRLNYLEWYSVQMPLGELSK